MTIKPKAIAAERGTLPDNRSGLIMGPLRGMARHAFRRFKRATYFALRPLAHGAKPMLLRLAHRPAARKLVIRVFGRHSKLVNTARLFLIGAPTSSPPVGVMALSPEMMAEGKLLSARGRDVLATLVEMRMQAQGEAQRASRT